MAALEATNAMAIRQGLGVYGDLSGDDSEWQAREPFPGKSETLGKTVLEPAMNLEVRHEWVAESGWRERLSE